jgi:hypothetical protein
MTGSNRHPQSIRRLETSKPSKFVSEVFAYQIANALKVDVSEFTDQEPGICGESAEGGAAA